MPRPLSTALAGASQRDGVLIAAGPRFGVDGAYDRFVRLPYTLPESELETAIACLAKTYAKLQLAPTPAAPRALEPDAFV